MHRSQWEPGPFPWPLPEPFWMAPCGSSMFRRKKVDCLCRLAEGNWDSVLLRKSHIETSPCSKTLDFTMLSLTPGLETWTGPSQAPTT